MSRLLSYLHWSPVARFSRLIAEALDLWGWQATVGNAQRESGYQGIEPAVGDNHGEQVFDRPERRISYVKSCDEAGYGLRQ